MALNRRVFAFLLEDQPEIPEVYKKAQALPGNENRVLTLNGIDKQQRPAGNGKEPEGNRHDRFSNTFGCNPLNDKSHHEHRLGEEAKNDPKIKLSDKNRVNPIIYGIHESFRRVPLWCWQVILQALSARFTFQSMIAAGQLESVSVFGAATRHREDPTLRSVPGRRYRTLKHHAAGGDQ